MKRKMLRRKIKTAKLLYEKGGIILILKHVLRKYILLLIERKTSLFSFIFYVILNKPFIVSQNEEFNTFITFLKERGIKNVLEIGTYKGGTAFLFSKMLNANVTTIDIKKFLLISIALKMKGIRFIHGDSHNDKTLEKVKGEYDLLFIDGDHAYESVKKDFEMYSHLIKNGGVIAFHDIYSCIGVNTFWNEIKRNYDYFEIKSKLNPLGIGVIIKKWKMLKSLQTHT